MRRHKQSLGLIILAPVIAFIIVAGGGLYFLILNSVEEFTARTIQQSFQSLSDGIHSIADRRVDQLAKSGQTEDQRRVRVQQVGALIEIEDFVRKNDIGVVIFSPEKNEAVMVSGLSEETTNAVIREVAFEDREISLFRGERYYADTFEFVPWSWRITLLKQAKAYDVLLVKARYFYVAAAVALFLIALFLVGYLRRMIARPIHLIVDYLRKGEKPNYKGIREFEFLSDSVGQMMQEVADNRDHLEELVLARTTELERANSNVTEKNRMLETLSSQLSKYLSPQVYASIFSGAQSVEIASRRKKLTVFFSDIANFTETTDRLESEELTQLINHYLTEMSQIALDYGATIDKYVGDAILIFFGDPESKGVKEDALVCVNMAVAMQKRMHDLADVWRDSGIGTPLQVRMGIHSGYCTVGNFGSEDRMDYTIIGGAVNTASRLQSLALPGEIIISYETFAHVKEDILCEEHGEVEVKGIAYPVATYRVVDSYKNLGRERRHFREDHPNVKVDLDLDAMTSEDRSQAEEVLHRALTVLSHSNQVTGQGSMRKGLESTRDGLVRKAQKNFPT